MFDVIIESLIFLFSLDNLFWIAVGTVLGLVAGTLPGISGVSVMAVLLPFTFGMAPQTAVLMLVGVYAAGVYSGSTGGILYRIPGDAAGIPASIEGYALAQKGRVGAALATDIYASFIGSVIGFIGALLLTPLFIEIARSLGTAERGLFALLALIMAGTGAISRADPLRGLIAVGIGLLLGTIGMHQNTGAIRFVQPFPFLWDGLNLVWVIVGLFAIPQLFRLANFDQNVKEANVSLKFDLVKETAEFFVLAVKHKWLLLRVGVMGVVIGALPGLGTVAASWLGYQEAYRSAKDKTRFGHGAIEGIAASETANNAAVPTTLVPLLALGIPGSAASALILGAFLMHGIYPGPQMMTVNPVMIWSILLGLFLTGVFFVAFGLPLHALIVHITKVRAAYLLPAIFAFSMIGIFVATGFYEGVYVALAIGIMAVVLEKLSIPVANVLLGVILGPIIERELLRAWAIGGAERFTAPVSAVLLLLCVSLLAFALYRAVRPERAGSAAPQVIEE